VQQVRVLASYGKLQSLWIEYASSGDLTGMVDRRVRTYGSRLFEYMQWGIYGDVSDSACVLRDEMEYPLCSKSQVTANSSKSRFQQGTKGHKRLRKVTASYSKL
jgi:hypothetical protein